MGVELEYPAFMPKPELHVDITSGSMTFLSTSKLTNVADYEVLSQVTAKLYVGGQLNQTLAINASTGAITGNAVDVTQGQTVEIVLEFAPPSSWPWHTDTILRRSAFFDVPTGNAQFDFDNSNNTMPVPGYEIGFGWDSNSKLKVGFKVGSGDGASQSITCTTRRLPAAQDSSYTVSLSDTSNVQSHTSQFTKSDVTEHFEIDLHLKSGTGTTRMEDRVRFIFKAKDLVAAYPSGFPTDDVSLVQSKTSAKLKLAGPGL